MTSRIMAAVVLLFAALSMTAGASADEALKNISDNAAGVTVSYPAGLESQAAKVMSITKKSIAPSLGPQKQSIVLLKDPDAVAKQIAALLGAEEKTESIKTRLAAHKLESQVLVQCFSHIRLFKKANAIATGGIDAGTVQLRYDKNEDEFNMAYDMQDADEAKIKRSFFPIIVNSDGSIRAEDKIADIAMSFLKSGDGIAIASIHEVVTYLIAQELKFFSPLARWFNDGVSGWVTRDVVISIDPKMAAIVNRVLMPGEASAKYRGQINLLAWPQSAFQLRSKLDPMMEAAKSQYSVEMMDKLLGKNGAQMLPKILSEIKYTSPDNDKIFAAIKKATGQDFGQTILAYVPDDIRTGIQKGETSKLSDDATGLLQEKKWAEAVAKLNRALEMSPTDANARLNLAWILRLAKDNNESEMQIFLVAALLKEQKYSFHMLAPSVEGQYVCGRLAIMMGNLDSARQFLDTVLKLKPDHADAKKALEQIRTMEDMAARQK